MPRLKAITDSAAKRLKAPAKGQVDYFDSSFPGLSLRVSCGGRKTWTYHYRIDGKLKRLTIDSYPALSVSAAPDAWRKARDQARSGRDPDQRLDGGATEFSEGVLEEWLKRDQAENRSRHIVEYRLRKYAL